MFTLNRETGEYSKTIQDPTVTPAGQLYLGINGVKISNSH